MGIAYLSLGSNQGALEHLPRALAELRARFGELRISPLYRTPAVGFDGPDFYNAAVVLESDLEPVELDAWLHALEDAHGRRRDVPRFSDRPLDIDIVFYDQRVKLVLSAEAQPEELIVKPENPIGAEAMVYKEFARTASRLREMQSKDYFGRKHASAENPQVMQK